MPEHYKTIGFSSLWVIYEIYKDICMGNNIGGLAHFRIGKICEVIDCLVLIKLVCDSTMSHTLYYQCSIPGIKSRVKQQFYADNCFV